MSSSSEAPGRLEQIRTLLNTWHMPHTLRRLVDDLPELAAHPRAWRRVMADIPPPTGTEVETLIELRAALRSELGREVPEAVAGWLQHRPVRACLTVDGGGGPITYRAGSDAVSSTLALVVEAVAVGRWARLKACPDCRHVFYDHSRNRSRTWCSMYAGTPDGRACGSIAKVRAYRDRQRTGQC